MKSGKWVSFSQAKKIIQQATGVFLNERDLIFLAESGDLRLGFNFRAVCKRECQVYLDGFSYAYKRLKDNSLANDIEESATSKLFQAQLSGKDDEFKIQWLKEMLDSSNKELRNLLPYPLKVSFWGNPLKKISCEDWITFALRYSLSQKILGARLPLSSANLEKLITHAEGSDDPDDILAKKLSLAFVHVESPNGEEEFPLAYSLIKDDIFVYGDSLERYLDKPSASAVEPSVMLPARASSPGTEAELQPIADKAELPWIARAEELGRELAEKCPKLSIEKIAQKIAPILEAEGYRVRGGNTPISADTIKRHALTGIKRQK